MSIHLRILKLEEEVIAKEVITKDMYVGMSEGAIKEWEAPAKAEETRISDSYRANLHAKEVVMVPEERGMSESARREQSQAQHQSQDERGREFTHCGHCCTHFLFQCNLNVQSFNGRHKQQQILFSRMKTTTAFIAPADSSCITARLWFQSIPL